MITANEAKQLAGPTFDEKIEDIGKAIEKRAKEGKRLLRCGYDYPDYPELWIHGGYSSTPEWKKAKEALEALGYKVTFYYMELQFVDMYTLIEW